MSMTSPSPIGVVRAMLRNMFVGRSHAIDGILAALIARETAILVGPPGTAKTALVETLAKMVNMNYFYYLLTKYTEPSELLGPLDINALRQGRYVRITTNRLPEAEIAFLDEVFKASSAVRNILLDIILNRRINMDGILVKLPLWTMYAASNEISTDEEDAAFYDRLVVRIWLDYVDISMLDELLEKGLQLAINSNGIEPIASKKDVEAAYQLAKQNAFEILQNQKLRNFVKSAIAKLIDMGFASTFSDRRKVKTLMIAGALAVVYGTKANPLTIAKALEYVVPMTVSDVDKVREALRDLMVINYQNIEKLEAYVATLENVVSQIETALANNNVVNAIEALMAVKPIISEVEALLSNISDEEATIATETITRIKELINKIKQYKDKLLTW